MTFIFITFLVFYATACLFVVLRVTTAPKNREIDHGLAWQTAQLAVLAVNKSTAGLEVTDEQRFNLAVTCFEELSPQLCPVLPRSAIITLIRAVITDSE